MSKTEGVIKSQNRILWKFGCIARNLVVFSRNLVVFYRKAVKRRAVINKLITALLLPLILSDFKTGKKLLLILTYAGGKQIAGLCQKEEQECTRKF